MLNLVGPVVDVAQIHRSRFKWGGIQVHIGDVANQSYLVKVFQNNCTGCSMSSMLATSVRRKKRCCRRGYGEMVSRKGGWRSHLIMIMIMKTFHRAARWEIHQQVTTSSTLKSVIGV